MVIYLGSTEGPSGLLAKPGRKLNVFGEAYFAIYRASRSSMSFQIQGPVYSSGMSLHDGSCLRFTEFLRSSHPRNQKLLPLPSARFYPKAAHTTRPRSTKAGKK